MIALAASLISRLETAIASELTRASEVSLSMRSKDRRGSILLIRPPKRDGVQQVCVMIGENKWRRRRSMYLSCVRITLDRGAAIEPPYDYISCTCSQFRIQERCLHIECITHDEANRMQLSSIFVNHERGI